MLTAPQIEHYRAEGYLLLDGFVDEAWLARLTAAMQEFVDESRSLDASTAKILLAPGHSRRAPKLRRIPHTVAWHPTFEEFGLRGPLVDIAADLLGADVRFHHSKLNFKWPSGGEAIDWHQDIQFWPHSNYSPLTIGVYLEDVDETMGPMGVIPGSHRGELFHLADQSGTWTGSINPEDLERVALDSVVWLTGRRGSVTVHSCRMVHGSQANESERMRPLLLHTYAAADALPLTDIMAGVPKANVLVRGTERPPRYEGEPCPMPPAFRTGEYRSIFSVQQREADRSDR